MVVTNLVPREKKWFEAQRLVALYDLSCTPPRMTSLVVSHDMPWLAATAARAPYGFISTKTGDIYSFDLRVRPPQLELLGSHGENCAEELECSDDGRLLFIAGLSAQLWDRQTGQRLWQRDDIWVREATFLPRSQRLLCGLATGEVLEFDSATGEELRRLCFHRWPIQSLSVSPSGEYLASTDNSGECVINHLPGGKVVQSRRFQHGAFAEFSPDDRTLLIANPFKGCLLATADTEAGELTSSIVQLSSFVLRLKTASDGTVFLVNGQPFVTAWNPTTRETYRVAPSVDELCAARFTSASPMETP
jgi:WD40 repeat protein